MSNPLRRIHPALRCVVFTTSTLPSHWPVENPCHVCAAYSGGCGRPSIQMSRRCSCHWMWVWSLIDGLRLVVDVGGDAKVADAAEAVGRRMRLALMLREREQRGVPAVGPHPHRVVDGKAGVVADVGTGNPFDLVFVEDRRPHPCQIHLRERGSRGPDQGRKHTAECAGMSHHGVLEKWLVRARNISAV